MTSWSTWRSRRTSSWTCWNSFQPSSRTRRCKWRHVSLRPWMWLRPWWGILEVNLSSWVGHLLSRRILHCCPKCNNKVVIVCYHHLPFWAWWLMRCIYSSYAHHCSSSRKRTQYYHIYMGLECDHIGGTDQIPERGHTLLQWWECKFKCFKWRQINNFIMTWDPFSPSTTRGRACSDSGSRKGSASYKHSVTTPSKVMISWM